jgi:hypothetical protein
VLLLLSELTAVLLADLGQGGQWGLNSHQAKVQPDPAGADTVTPFGAEFLVEGIIIVILGALLEILWGIDFDASVVVVG